MCLIQPLLRGKEGGGRDDAVRSSPCHGYHPGQLPWDLISLKTQVWRTGHRPGRLNTRLNCKTDADAPGRGKGVCVCMCVGYVAQKNCSLDTDDEDMLKK